MVPQTMQEPLMEGENVLEVSGEEIPSMELADQIAVRRQIPVTDSELTEGDTNLDPVLASTYHLQWDIDDSGLETGDIIQDAKIFQEVATEYQLVYQSLDAKYTHQAVLVKEASEALKASESHVAELQEELMALKQNRNNDIQQAVGQVVSQYEQKLSTEQSHTQEHQEHYRLIKLFHFKSMFDLGTGLTGLIWSQMLLDQVHHQYHLDCHHIYRHCSVDQVRCR